MPGFVRYGHIYGAIDDLYQKSVFSKSELFFAMRSIRSSTAFTMLMGLAKQFET